MIQKMATPARILIVSDQRSEAQSIQRLVAADYEDVHISFDPSRAVHDFESSRPDLLLLAFKEIEKAQRYYLGLYRLGSIVHEHPHRTVVICSKDEVKQAFELCRKQYFDDYVLLWPVPYDGSRLPMSIHVALRELKQAQNAGITDHQLREHAKRLGQFEHLLDERLAQGGREVEAAADHIARTSRGLGEVAEALARRMDSGRFDGAVEIKDPSLLKEELEHFSHETLEPLIESGRLTMEPLRRWAHELHRESMAQLEQAHGLLRLIEKIPQRVLVVDDDDFSQKIVGRLLERGGFEPMFAASGTEALTLLRHARPALILMDYMLPGLDGVETTHRLKATRQFSDIPVIMFTGQSNRDTVIKSLAAGAVDFIAKPIDPTILISKISRYLGTKSD